MSTDEPENQENQATPSVQMMRVLYGSLTTQLVSISAELGLADLVARGPRHVDELASITSTNPQALYRALRTLASQGVFTEVTPGTFGLTPLANTLRSDVPDSMRDAARSFGMRARQHSFAELEYSIRTGRPAFDYVHGTDLWSYLAANPEHAAIFNSHMGNVASKVHASAMQNYDLSKTEHLVDVGGGHGHLVAKILQRYPQLRAVVFDAPHVVADAEQVLAEAGVRERAELVGGNFFAEVPAGGDTYLLSWVLHDWNDAQAQTVLGNIRDAMDPAGQVVAVDAVVPPGDTPHHGKLTDMVMLALQTGYERTEAEFSALFEAAGLQLVETRETGAPTSVIVAAPA